MLVKYVINVPLLGFLSCFSSIELQLQAFGRKTSEVKCQFFHIISRVHMDYQCDLSLLLLTLIRWLEGVFVRFLYCKVTIFSPFLYCPL